MSDKINDGGNAFPEPGLSGLPNGEFIHGRAGMTLRDYFAAKALVGICTHVDDYNGKEWQGDMAQQAYEIADAMLKAREAKP